MGLWMNWMKIVRANKAACAILLFFALFSIFHFWLKPSISYTPDGEFRHFGLEYTDETILPIWLVSMVLGVICYLFVLYLCSLRVVKKALLQRRSYNR
jgi:hypothetical protein